MITGHASHQIGLDADVWLTPMPDRRLSRAEREEMSATDMVRPDLLDIDPKIWTPEHTALIKAAAKEPAVARIFVNPAIKRALCREAGADRNWLPKVRPMFGHNYHFHIRIACPAGDAGCGNQDPPPAGDGCGAELAAWFTPQMLHPKPGKPRPPLTHGAVARRVPAGLCGRAAETWTEGRASAGRDARADLAGHARAADAAIAIRVLGEVLLVVVLGIVERARHR